MTITNHQRKSRHRTLGLLSAASAGALASLSAGAVTGGPAPSGYADGAAAGIATPAIAIRPGRGLGFKHGIDRLAPADASGAPGAKT
ncbi:MAG TPA: hypothetical protein VEC01_20550 [Noviherbaspirillum sp.]|uniref:hypothetical protein n=1 Tax=Noviherbaspirillum sp. TaxID=1926288 RepID=UPI002D5C441C|nr:hypothetical protein [Noviherbaspirillum sp.]HYD97724.1 hypothetical protein [Noviherbaspirillum sp.]